jgi:hypothetical protein
MCETIIVPFVLLRSLTLQKERTPGEFEKRVLTRIMRRKRGEVAAEEIFVKKSFTIYTSRQICIRMLKSSEMNRSM